MTFYQFLLKRGYTEIQAHMLADPSKRSQKVRKISDREWVRYLEGENDV